MLGARHNELVDRLIVSNYEERPLRRSRAKDEDEAVDESGENNEDDKGSGQRRRAKRQEVSVDPICFPKNKTALPQKWDWRAMGKVTPAKYQGSCGSCWAFASIATLESAYLIKGKTKDRNFDLSEQQLVSCAKTDGCNGGTSVDAFNFILSNNGVTDEKTLPYNHKVRVHMCFPFAFLVRHLLEVLFHRS